MSDPANSERVYEALLAARHERRPCVLVTVVGFRGSTPRKGGAKMLVFEDGPAIGTIGGGAIEHLIIAKARELCRDDSLVVLDRHLTHELGMCCGGAVSVLLEPQTYTPRLIVFGAGHVAEPLVRVARLADFDVTVVDHRPELATEERFAAANRIVVEEPLDVIDALELDDSVFIVIVTHDHALDEDIAREVLRRPHRFVGIIGSVRKREMFRKRLRAAGFTDEQVARMRTPLGVDISAETPAEIAVSIVGELISVRRSGRTTEWPEA